jgi:hypothetical protein
MAIDCVIIRAFVHDLATDNYIKFLSRFKSNPNQLVQKLRDDLKDGGLVT